jgi:hypothetical protein
MRLKFEDNQKLVFFTGYLHRHRVWTWMGTAPCALESIASLSPRRSRKPQAYLNAVRIGGNRNRSAIDRQPHASLVSKMHCAF